MSRIYIAGGVTSNLFSALLPGFRAQNHLIWATIREPVLNVERIQALSDAGVEFISKEKGTQFVFDAVLWLSTHVDFDFLAALSARTSTLAVSSAAIMDYYLGNATELNAYQQSKLLLSRVPNIVTLIPGFYIEDIPTPKWASTGLHGATTVKLFSDDTAQFDWNKSYSVTPKHIIVNAITEWLSKPEIFPKNQPIIICSDRVYRRWELRQMAGFPTPENCLPRQLDPIYAAFPHSTMRVTEECVRAACIEASKIK